MKPLLASIAAPSTARELPFAMENETGYAATTEESILPLTDGTPAAVEEVKVPKLTSSEFGEYNRLAEYMDSFHNHFRVRWNELYATASGKGSKDSNPAKLSPSRFLKAASQFLDTLTMHHNIEETYVFPHLSTRMPAFQKNLVLINQHKQIHAGMEKLGLYLAECREGVRDLRMEEVQELMDSWKDVLWSHLDREVEELGAEKMRQYWSIEEMKSFRF